MNEIIKRANALSVEINEATKKIGLNGLLSELETLQSKTRESSFWQDNAAAQSTARQVASLDAKSKPWVELQSAIKDVAELSELNDTGLKKDLQSRLETLTETFNKLKSLAKLNKLYDDHGALVSIHAGAGGTDAQDWTQMLFRMYSRWTEKIGVKLQIIEQSAGEEAGLKSVTFSVDIPYGYGRLKGEHGVHRLVRLSPFNADNLRQTSFAKVEVMPKIDQPAELQLDDKDLKIDVYRAGGHGGQSVNTTDSAVRITHIPTGITVSIQNERSQIQNKETAMSILRSRLAQLQIDQHKDKLSELKGPSQSAEWGSQIRNYVLHPYKQVKDLRTKYETSDVQGVLNGNLEGLIDAYLEHNITV